MYLYPYKIFALSKNKRLLKDNFKIPCGIYDVDRLTYNEAVQAKAENTNSYISVLLGEVRPGVFLNVWDLDGAVEEGEGIKPETQKLLENFEEDEWEFSSSGTGIHIYTLTKEKFETFHYKNYFGEGLHSDLEFYSDKRHIVSTTFDFKNIDLKIGKYDNLLKSILEEYQEKNKSSFVQDVCEVFGGKIITDEEQLQNSFLAGRTPVESMDILRKCCLKDDVLKEVIDMEASCVDQSQHDAKLLRKLMYYTLSFESAHKLAKKTNYYKSKDARHIKKFDDPKYIERTRHFIERS